MIGFLLNMVNPLKGITRDLAQAYMARQDAQTEQQRIEADAQIEQLKSREAVLIAEQGSWMTRMIRPLWTLPFIIYAWKVLVWDMVLGMGSTPVLGEQMAKLMTVMAGAYFLTRGGERIAARFLKKR